MSNFDPTSPSYVPPGGVVVQTGDGFSYAEGNQTATTVLAAVSLSASTAIAGLTNAGCRGALFAVNVTQLPGSASTTIALKIFTTVGGSNVAFAQRTPISATGVSLFMVYPGISASAGGVASPLPKTFGANLSLSTGATSKEVVLSVTMMRIR